MRSCLDESIPPSEDCGAIQVRRHGRIRGRGRHRLIAGGGTVALLFAMMATIGTTATPAYANTTINGCTIVAHPTATRFTDCPGANLTGANLSGVNLSFANLSDAQFIA